MQTIVRPTLAAIAVLALLMGCSAVVPRASGERPGATAGFGDGAPSVDELMQDLVLAIRDNDEGALRRLRVSEDEYLRVILPGSVPPGDTPMEYAPNFREFLWGSLDEKNRHGERTLLTAYGGRALTVERASFQSGVRAYQGYRAHRLLDLTLRDDRGVEVHLEMGSVAQVGNRYKFISFTRD
jgi:hypothetical protein